ncbi:MULTISPECIES: DUF1707 and DUF4190 domain-containing protein [Kitasatospora]|uniref:DUF1707 and DUF4190 domain-containing protein n=1 Tax=Kitasatospora cathayae TaxID=3004092 RepID=A0ABY7Q6Q8_9ACTN|nr:DUF1707 and DUF4190 domain-containing protein [Kitasatospora sp. HUAS 3-15]WBP88375.1 DUF1707 and DUF4190 domain-containing protein [Kitasatospora sp. HUAS 3-15]
MSVQPWGEPGPAHRPAAAGWQPVPSPQAAMRASHADRDRAVDVLKAGFAEGRLSAQEYEQRHEAASRALTYGELAALVADLPAGPMAAPLQAAQPVPATFLVPPPPKPRPTSVLAVVSMVCGLTGFLALPVVPAVITGHIARSQIRERDMDGDWAAVLGLVLGYLGAAFWTLIILLGAL